MRLIFIGATEFGRRCLTACLGLDAVHVVGVVTAAPRFRISYRPSGVTNVRYGNVAELAQAASIPVLTVKRGMSDARLLDSVAELQPDAFVVAGWFHMVPRSWRELAPAYGLHASLLPEYRGGAPLVWAMINGEMTTGITMFLLDDGVDTGPTVGQRVVRIRPDDTIATLYSRVDEAGVELIRADLPRIAAGTVVPTPQEPSRCDPYPQRGPEDGLIDWFQSAEEIDRFVRAQTRPYPGAFTIVNGCQVKIWRAAVADHGRDNGTPGRVRLDSDGYRVECLAGALRLLEVSQDDESRAPTTAMDEIFGGGGSFCPPRVRVEDVASGSRAGTVGGASEFRSRPPVRRDCCRPLGEGAHARLRRGRERV